MGWVTNAAIFFVIWWTVLFLVLPFGVRSQIEDDDVTLGTAHGAPADSRIGRKLAQTTLLALLVFGLFYVATQVLGWGLDDLPHIIPGT